jgi:hypothetical protein
LAWLAGQVVASEQGSTEAGVPQAECGLPRCA